MDQETVNTIVEFNRIENNDSTGFESGIRVTPWGNIVGNSILNNTIRGDFNNGKILNERVDTIVSGNILE